MDYFSFLAGCGYKYMYVLCSVCVLTCYCLSQRLYVVCCHCRRGSPHLASVGCDKHIYRIWRCGADCVRRLYVQSCHLISSLFLPFAANIYGAVLSQTNKPASKTTTDSRWKIPNSRAEENYDLFYGDRACEREREREELRGSEFIYSMSFYYYL